MQIDTAENNEMKEQQLANNKQYDDTGVNSCSKLENDYNIEFFHRSIVNIAYLMWDVPF